MKQSKQTALKLIKKIQSTRDELFRLESEISQLPGCEFIQAVIERNTFELLESDANLLVTELQQRDEPMTLKDIVAVFDASGFAYEMRHILECNPDSDDIVRLNRMRYMD
jgi:hypothetical protein